MKSFSVLVALAITIGACGDATTTSEDDSSAETATESTAGEETAAEDTGEEAAAEETIVADEDMAEALGVEEGEELEVLDVEDTSVPAEEEPEQNEASDALVADVAAEGGVGEDTDADETEEYATFSSVNDVISVDVPVRWSQHLAGEHISGDGEWLIADAPGSSFLDGDPGIFAFILNPYTVDSAASAMTGEMAGHAGCSGSNEPQPYETDAVTGVRVTHTGCPEGRSAVTLFVSPAGATDGQSDIVIFSVHVAEPRDLEALRRAVSTLELAG